MARAYALSMWAPFQEHASLRATWMVKEHGLPPLTTWGVGDAFAVRLYDPVLERAIEHSFKPVPLGDDLAERQSEGRALKNFPMMD